MKCLLFLSTFCVIVRVIDGHDSGESSYVSEQDRSPVKEKINEPGKESSDIDGIDSETIFRRESDENSATEKVVVSQEESEGSIDEVQVLPKISKEFDDEKSKKKYQDTMKRFQSEMAAGDMADLFGSNPHNHQSHYYKDLGRRFVPQYKYTGVYNNVPAEPRESELIPQKAPPELVLVVAKESALIKPDKQSEDAANDINNKKILRSGDYWNGVWKEEVIPKSALRNASQNNDLAFNVGSAQPEDNVLTLEKAPPELVLLVAKESALLKTDKTGEGADDVDLKKILRSGDYWNGVWKEEVNPKNVLRSAPQKKVLGSIKANIKPGSELYKVVSRLKKISPRLIYIINKKQL